MRCILGAMESLNVTTAITITTMLRASAMSHQLGLYCVRVLQYEYGTQHPRVAPVDHGARQQRTDPTPAPVHGVVDSLVGRHANRPHSSSQQLATSTKTTRGTRG